MTDSQRSSSQPNPAQTSASAASVNEAATSASPAATPVMGTPTVKAEEPVPSYVKLAMRNMVKKGRKSLFHFTLTTVALLGILVGLAYVTR